MPEKRVPIAYRGIGGYSPGDLPGKLIVEKPGEVKARAAGIVEKLRLEHEIREGEHENS